MATPKSPFLVYQNFISPKLCEELVELQNFGLPDFDAEGKPTRMMRHCEKGEELLFEAAQPIINDVFNHFNAQYRGTERMQFEFLAEGVEAELGCDNSQFLRKSWVLTKERDFTGVLFLSDHNSDAPFDDYFEVYGGKLEFPQHDFGFLPERGTLIVFPSGPHFIYRNAPIVYGDLFQVKFHMGANTPYLHQPDDFPGDHTTWFSNLS